jgi:hypothetical protein
MENPDIGQFCMGCGERFIQDTAGIASPSHPASSPAYRPSSPSSTPDFQPAHVKYAQLISHPYYQRMVTGCLVFALGPVIAFGLGFIFDPEDILGTLLTVLIDFICYGFFIYGIYLFSQLEPRSLNDQISSVPLYFMVYAVGGLVTSILFSLVPAITLDMTLNELKSIAVQILGVLVLEGATGIFLLIGALKFTNWFKELVFMFQAPYNAHTNRIKWFAICMLIGMGMLMVSYLMLITAIDTLSEATVDTAMTVIGLAALVLLAAMILQVAGGYKVYSFLNNVRNARYAPPPQQEVHYKYE